MLPRYLTALPVYNEQSHIRPVLDRVRLFSPEILVVNDGSSDNTAGELAAQSGIHVVTHRQNLGYGAALRSAFDFAIDRGFDVLVTIDCDGQHQPELIPELVRSVDLNPSENSSGPPWDIVSGSRYLSTFQGDSVPPEARRRINVEITQTLNELLGLHLTDAFCGFKSYRVEALRGFQITELGYAMPLQFWVQAVAMKLKITEFPVPLIYLEEERSFGGSLDDANRRLAYYHEVIERELATACLPGQTGPQSSAHDANST
jgi:glycosyltransferase involved in cell wall biosynthesis